MIEAQIQYLTGALRARATGCGRSRSRPDARAAYNSAEIDRMTEGTVWVSGGCKSWYIDANGHNSTLLADLRGPSASACASSTSAYALGAAAQAGAAGSGGVTGQRVVEPRRPLVVERQDRSRQVELLGSSCTNADSWNQVQVPG